MGQTVVFVDGEYVRKIAKNMGYHLDIEKFIKKILALTNTDEQGLLRVYYYTSPPYQSSKPTEDEKRRYSRFQKFIEYLKQLENFEVRLGKLEKRGDEYSQKMVDVLLSIDLVALSATRQVSRAILVAGDSDFVPAVNKAKSLGVKLILVCSAQKSEYHRALWEECDQRFHLSADDLKECERNQTSS